MGHGISKENESGPWVNLDLNVLSIVEPAVMQCDRCTKINTRTPKDHSGAIETQEFNIQDLESL